MSQVSTGNELKFNLISAKETQLHTLWQVNGEVTCIQETTYPWKPWEEMEQELQEDKKEIDGQTWL
jgi:hypothetical protein